MGGRAERVGVVVLGRAGAGGLRGGGTEPITGLRLPYLVSEGITAPCVPGPCLGVLPVLFLGATLGGASFIFGFGRVTNVGVVVLGAGGLRGGGTEPIKGLRSPYFVDGAPYVPGPCLGVLPVLFLGAALGGASFIFGFGPLSCIAAFNLRASASLVNLADCFCFLNAGCNFF